MEIEGGHAFSDLIKYYETQLKRYEIPVNCNFKITKENFMGIGADVAIIATGAVISNRLLHKNEANIFNAFDVLKGFSDIENDVIILGGGRAGMVTAELLSKSGKNVTIVEESNRIAQDVIPTFKWRHYSWLQQLGIKTLTNAKTEISENNKILINGEIHKDVSIIAASPRKSVQDLFKREFDSDEIYIIGDAVMPRSLHNAIHEGYKLGIKI